MYGYTPDVGEKLFYEASAGGVDIIKDDELIGGDRVFNKIERSCQSKHGGSKTCGRNQGRTDSVRM